MHVLQGLGVSAFDPKWKLYPLVSGADAARDSASKETARYFPFVQASGGSSAPHSFRNEFHLHGVCSKFLNRTNDFVLQ